MPKIYSMNGSMRRISSMDKHDPFACINDLVTAIGTYATHLSLSSLICFFLPDLNKKRLMTSILSLRVCGYSRHLESEGISSSGCFCGQCLLHFYPEMKGRILPVGTLPLSSPLRVSIKNFRRNQHEPGETRVY